MSWDGYLRAKRLSTELGPEETREAARAYRKYRDESGQNFTLAEVRLIVLLKSSGVTLEELEAELLEEVVLRTACGCEKVIKVTPETQDVRLTLRTTPRYVSNLGSYLALRSEAGLEPRRFTHLGSKKDGKRVLEEVL